MGSMMENMFGLGESASFDENEVIEIAKLSFETGHYSDRDDFASDEEWNKYCEYMQMGPVGFYEEYSDLDWDPMFVQEYGDPDLISESNKTPEFKVGDIVIHIDDNPPTKGIILDIQDDVAYVTVANSDDDIIEVPLQELQLAEESASTGDITSTDGLVVEGIETIPDYDTEVADHLLTAYKAAREAVDAYTKTGIISDVKSYTSMVLSETERAVELLNQRIELPEDVSVKTLSSPETEESTKLFGFLTEAIKEEYNAINLYNELALLAKENDRNDLVDLVNHINAEENSHIGILQEALKTLSENSKAINDGQSEALELLELKEENKEDGPLIEGYIQEHREWVDIAKSIFADANIEHESPYINFGNGHLEFSIEPNDELFNKLATSVLNHGFKEVERHLVNNKQEDSYIVFIREDEFGRLVLGLVMNADQDYATLDIGYSKDADDDEWFEESFKLELK